MKRAAFALLGLLGLLALSAHAETVLEYTGPALKRIAGDWAVPDKITALQARVVLLDGMHRPGTRLQIDGAPHDRPRKLKSLTVSDGLHRYEYDTKEGINGNVRITINESGEVAEWQIELDVDKTHSRVGMFGPGSVRPSKAQSHPDVPPQGKCPSADVAYARTRSANLAQSGAHYWIMGCGRGRWTAVPGGIEPLPEPASLPFLYTIEQDAGAKTPLVGWVAFDRSANVIAARVNSRGIAGLVESAYDRRPFDYNPAPQSVVESTEGVMSTLQFGTAPDASAAPGAERLTMSYAQTILPGRTAEGKVNMTRLTCTDLTRPSNDRYAVRGYVATRSDRSKYCGIEMRYYPGYHVTAEMAAAVCGIGAWSYSQQIVQTLELEPQRPAHDGTVWRFSEQTPVFDPPPSGWGYCGTGRCISGNGVMCPRTSKDTYYTDVTSCSLAYPYYRVTHGDPASGWSLAHHTMRGNLRIDSNEPPYLKFNDDPSDWGDLGVLAERHFGYSAYSRFVTQLVKVPLREECRAFPIRLSPSEADRPYGCASSPSDLPSAHESLRVSQYMRAPERAIYQLQWRRRSDGNIEVTQAEPVTARTNASAKEEALGWIPRYSVNPLCLYSSTSPVRRPRHRRRRS